MRGTTTTRPGPDRTGCIQRQRRPRRRQHSHREWTNSRGPVTPAPGQYTDTETGQQYLRARYYDPTTGQFLTRDPAVRVSQDPYGYAANDPVNNTD